MFNTPEELGAAPAREFVRLFRDAVIMADAEFRIMMWNEAAEILYGWTAAEVMGRNGTELLRTEFPGEAKADRLKAIQDVGFFRGEGIQSTRDGRRIYVEVDSMALKDAQGKVTGYLSFNRDITERKLEEQKLLGQRRFLDNLANSLPGLIGYWDADLRCGFANQAYREWFGRDPASMIGMHIRDLLGDKVFALNEPYIRGALAGEPQRFNRLLTLPDGSERYTLAQYMPHSEEGKAAGFFVLVSDMTAQKRVESRLQETLDIHNALTENTAFALIQADQEGNIRFINPAATQLLGYTAEEVVGKHTPAIFHDLGEVAARAQEFTRELGRPVPIGFETFIIKSMLGLPNEHEWTYIRKNGERFPVILSVTAIRDSGGTITGYMGTAADISKRKRLQDELRKAIAVVEAANRAKSEFLAIMSHEIRTPLNGVLGVAQLMMDTPLSPEQCEYMRVMTQSGGVLLSIISDILDYSKIEAGKMEAECAPFDLAQAAGEVVNILSLRAQEKGVYLRLETAPSGGPAALGDPGRVRQILMNLVGNALKFTDRGGVDLRVLLQDGSWRVEVQDTGTGITEESQAKIFGKFNQADASTTRKFGGTGLGLAISKGLAEMMGGSLGFSSESGKGSLFWLTLPAGNVAPGESPSRTEADSDWSRAEAHADPYPAPPGAEPARDKAPEKAANFAGMRVLVVEDNRVNQMVATSMLRKFGCAVETAANGEEAFAKVCEGVFAAVFMDCQMPVMDGYEATRLIREWESGHEGGRLPIIALTASAFSEDRQRCLAAGMDDFVSKPLRTADIARKLSALFPAARPGGG